MGPYRTLTVLAGIVSGLALATGTMLAGAMAPIPAQWLPGAPAPSPSARLGSASGPLTGHQPELAAAVLTEKDMPPRGSATSRADKPRAERTGRADTRPADTGPADIGASPERAPCRRLFESPSDLVPGGSERVTRDIGPAGDRLRQTVVVLDRPDAAEAVTRIRRAAAGCPRFAADGGRGAPLQVRAGRLAPWPAGDEGYGVPFTDLAGRPVGWLGVARVGPVLTVLHTVADSAMPEPDVVRHGQATLRRAAEKLRPLALLAGPG